jgi:hypothetical protein
MIINALYVLLALDIIYLILVLTGFKFVVYDRDKDGIVQEGTRWERKHFYIEKNPLTQKKYFKFF